MTTKRCSVLFEGDPFEGLDAYDEYRRVFESPAPTHAEMIVRQAGDDPDTLVDLVERGSPLVQEAASARLGELRAEKGVAS